MEHFAITRWLMGCYWTRMMTLFRSVEQFHSWDSTWKRSGDRVWRKSVWENYVCRDFYRYDEVCSTGCFDGEQFPY